MTVTVPVPAFRKPAGERDHVIGTHVIGTIAKATPRVDLFAR